MTNDRRLADNIQAMGDNLASRLTGLIGGSPDMHSTVQAIELFVRAIVHDCLVRSKVLAERDYD